MTSEGWAVRGQGKGAKFTVIGVMTRVKTPLLEDGWRERGRQGK
jgi:hypothetical protein